MDWMGRKHNFGEEVTSLHFKTISDDMTCVEHSSYEIPGSLSEVLSFQAQLLFISFSALWVLYFLCSCKVLPILPWKYSFTITNSIHCITTSTRPLIQTLNLEKAKGFQFHFPAMWLPLQEVVSFFPGSSCSFYHEHLYLVLTFQFRLLSWLSLLRSMTQAGQSCCSHSSRLLGGIQNFLDPRGENLFRSVLVFSPDFHFFFSPLCGP